MDERLSWPGWLTHSGWFTRISGHLSATGRAQDRESTPAEDRRSTTEPRNQGHVTHFEFRRPNDISGTAEARVVKFYMQVDCVKS